MSVIWIFREMRSGSTAFAETLAERLNRPYYSVADTSTDKHPLVNDENTIFSTHSFNSISVVESYTDPILIRCTRRDLTEQCMSHILATKINNAMPDAMRFWNHRRDESRNVHRSTFDNAEPLLITKKEVLDYISKRQSWKTDWDSYASKYRNYTIFYEDLCEKGVDIPDLGVYSFSIADGATTRKLPDYKERLILNHEMVRNWIAEYSNVLDKKE